MSNPEWLAKDEAIVDIVDAKPPFVGPDFVRTVFVKQHEALKRAHAHILELRGALRRAVGCVDWLDCSDCEHSGWCTSADSEHLLDRQEPPEVK